MNKKINNIHLYNYIQRIIEYELYIIMYFYTSQYRRKQKKLVLVNIT